MALETSDSERENYPLWLEERVRFADTDMFGHVNHAAFATLFEVGRSTLGLGSTAKQLMPPGSGSVVRSLYLDYIGDLNYPATVLIGTRVGQLGRSSFVVEQILLEGDRVVAKAVATYVLADLAEGRSVELPEALRSYFHSLADNPPPV